MKIGIVSHTFLPRIGGKEIYIYNMARTLVKMGHEVHVITGAECWRRADLDLKGIQVHYLPCIKIRIPRSSEFYRVLPTLPFFLRTRSFDVVNLQEYSTLSTDLAAFYFGLKKVPMVLTVHNPWFISNPAYLFVLKLHEQTLGRVETRLIHNFIVVSRKMYRRFTREFPRAQDRTWVIHNGVSKEQVAVPPAPSDTRTILFLSRISKDKGLDLLIEAVARLKEKHPRDALRLLVVGPRSTFQEEAEHLVQSLHLQDCVAFPGPVYEKRKWEVINAADCICLPSLNESCPSTILEAMVMKKPIIATRIPGILEILPGSRYGYLFEKGCVDDLAEKLDRALFRSEETSRRVESAYEHVQQFNWTVISSEIEAVFQKTIHDCR